MEEKKKRAANYSNNEKNILCQLVMKRKDVLENKRTDASTNSRKQSEWLKVSEEFNSISTECFRTPQNLKICWENLKRNRKIKKQVSCRKKEMFMTELDEGERQLPFSNDPNIIVEAVMGPSRSPQPQPPLSNDASNIVEAVMGPSPSSDGLSDIYDSDDDLWENWTSKSQKRSATDPLSSSCNSSEKKSVERRLPRATGSSADNLLRSKIELVEILKKNAVEEGNLKILILKEQLKQEQLKTENLISING